MAPIYQGKFQKRGKRDTHRLKGKGSYAKRKLNGAQKQFKTGRR